MEPLEEEDAFGKANRKSARMERLPVNEVKDGCIPAVTGAKGGT